MSSIDARRPLVVYYLGGRILGYRHLYKPPESLKGLVSGILDVLEEEFIIEQRPSSCGDESPIQFVLSILASSLSATQPPEVLILHNLHSLFDTVDFLVAGQEDFAQSAITLVGTKYLLAGGGPYGDPDGNFARTAIANAMKGGLRPPGIYVASGEDAIPWPEAELVCLLRRRKVVQ